MSPLCYINDVKFDSGSVHTSDGKNVLELTAGICCLNLLAMTNLDDSEIAVVANPLENTV